MKDIQIGLVEGLKAIAQGKNVSKEIIIEALQEALVSAARKYTGIQKNIVAVIEEETNDISVYLSVQVVDDYPDVPDDADADEVKKLDEQFMLLHEAQEYNEDASVGDLLEMDIPIEGFGRMAIQTAKQLLMQKVREAERQRIVMDYQDRIGTLISGVVQQVDRGNIVVNLGKTEAIIPPREQIKRERFRQGDSIQAYIAGVSDSARGAQVVLSRAHEGFLVELFKLEVPEIYDGIVEIKGAARDPGNRAKISVFSSDDRIDPVGACVGMKGNRVQSIVRELANERIDIVNWSDDNSAFIKRALAPAEVVKLHEVQGTKRVVLVVADENLAQAIGRNGQNIKLASKLTDRELDIYGEEEWMDFNDDEKQRTLTPKDSDTVVESGSQDRLSELNALFDSDED
ncbi:MAG: transcription termination factor NusA [Fibrobacterales bacterium]